MAKRVKTNNNNDFDAWANLPLDILDIILDNLFHLSDNARFGAVCKSWNSAAVFQKQKRAAAAHDQPPMLLFINSRDYSNHDGFFKLGQLTTKLYSISEERLYENGFIFDTSESCKNNDVLCAGSAYGWLAMVVGKSACKSSIRLLNPFIRKNIEFPAIPKNYGFVRKIIMSCDPLKNPDELFLAAWTSGDEIAIIKLGEKSWSVISSDSYNYPVQIIHDIVFHKGFLYMVDAMLTLVEIHYKHSYICYYDRRQTKQRYDFKAVVVICYNGLLLRPPAWNCLAESSNGDDLLLVQSRNYLLLDESDGVSFAKLVKHNRSPEGYWLRIQSLKDDALFVTDKSCLCMPAASKSIPKSVYFALNYRDQRYNPKYSLRFRRSDTAIYNLWDRTVRNMGGLDQDGSQNPLCPIALLSPSMC